MPSKEEEELKKKQLEINEKMLSVKPGMGAIPPGTLLKNMGKIVDKWMVEATEQAKKEVEQMIWTGKMPELDPDMEEKEEILKRELGRHKLNLSEPEEDNWIHRSANMRCGSCMSFVKKEGRIPGLGRCRRKAPTLGGWPVIFESDWCGDHKLNENYEDV